MAGRFSIARRFWARVRREVAREARQHMMSYCAARQSFDLYDMRLDAAETGLVKKIVALEARIEALEAALREAEPASMTEPRPIAVGER
jgi:hypothetical protein